MRVVVWLAIVSLTCCVEWFEEGDPHMLVGTTFNSTVNDTSHCKFIKFFTPWCRFCRILKNIIDQHKQTTFSNRSDVKFYEVNCHTSPDICMPLQVYAVPFVIMFGKDGTKKQTTSGVYPKQWYTQFINNNCGSVDPQIEQAKPQANAQKQPEIDQKHQETLQRKQTIDTDKSTMNTDSEVRPQIDQQGQTEGQRKTVDKKLTSESQTNQNIANSIADSVPSQSKAQIPEEVQLSHQLKDPIHQKSELEHSPSVGEPQVSKPRSSQSSLQKEEVQQDEPEKGRSFRSFIIIIGGLAIGAFVHHKCTQTRNQPRPI